MREQKLEKKANSRPRQKSRDDESRETPPPGPRHGRRQVTDGKGSGVGAGGPRIADLHRVPDRYLRSVHLERDFDDKRALAGYIATEPTLVAARRIVEGLRPGSGRRAWRITGDYGSGKSSFALMLAHLLRDPTHSALLELRRAVDFRGLGVTRTPRVFPLLVTGSREGLAGAIGRTVGRAIDQLRGRGPRPRALTELAKRAAEATGGDSGALVEVLSGFSAHMVGAGYTGVLLVLDELGKFLEYAALHPDRDDVYALQRLAEAASRSTQHPFVVVGLLHQGFQAYAERLPSTAKHEWEKVAGRFDEIVFDQPLSHVAALTAGALNVDVAHAPSTVVKAAREISRTIANLGWFRDPRRSSDTTLGRQALGHDPLSLYPLHPTVLPVLVRFFARFGQHERSLFSFLLSSEPYGLRAFSDRRATGDSWYRLADFYDYVRTVYGHQLAGASYRSQWLRISGVVEAFTDVDETQLGVLKTVAILNAVDADHLIASDAVIVAAMGPAENPTIATAALRKRGALFDRGSNGGYRLWPTTSVNLEGALEEAHRALGGLDGVASYLAPYLDTRPLLARRHSIETGTLRYFEVRYADAESLLEVALRPTEADGVVVVALCDNRLDRHAAEGVSVRAELVERPEVLFAIPLPLIGLGAELHDVRCWQWVTDNTPELANDTYAAAEVARQLAAARQVLAARLSTVLGFADGEEARAIVWARAGQPVEVAPGRGLLGTLSEICDELYREAPLIRNELLNRRTLSSAATAARMRLIERMFTAADRPLLGIDPLKAPPEKSMYLSVLEEGRVHRETGGGYLIGEPTENEDPLRLRPALGRVMTLLENAGGERVPVRTLMSALRDRPYGVRGGVIPLLLAITAVARAHELAVYENGTFLQRFRPSEFLRLTKLPTAFEFQLCRVSGVRAEVFDHLVRVFVADRPAGRRAELLDVVTPLCVFAAQLPEYTRRTTKLSPTGASVRDALLSAREPGTLLFHELPLACDVPPFVLDEAADAHRVTAFVDSLRAAHDELRAAYPLLLSRLGARAAHALREGSELTSSGAGTILQGNVGDGDFAVSASDRQRLTERATRVALAAREPRLRAFAHRIADTGLAVDTWAEALGSFVLAKPPAKWAPGDESRAMDEIDVLSATFRRVEAVAFKASAHASALAVRVSLTRGDGIEACEVIHTHPEDEAAVRALVAALATSLPADAHLSIAALSRLLWTHLEHHGASEPVGATVHEAAVSRLPGELDNPYESQADGTDIGTVNSSRLNNAPANTSSVVTETADA